MTSPAVARAAWAAWRRDAARPFAEGDTHLAQLLAAHGHAAAMPKVEAFGATCAAIDELVRENNREEHLPQLRRWDGQGNRIEQVLHHETYHQVGRAIYGSGVMANYRQPGCEVLTMAQVYLSGQNGEAGHNCPLACTAGLIKILQRHGNAFAPWIARLTDPNYDAHFHGAQFMTEAQGGADIGANALEARPCEIAASWSSEISPGTPAPTWVTLHGEKWFCSVADAHLMLVTARPTGANAGTKGVRTYAVPRRLPNGELNRYELRRLKFKLGTKSMASAEIDFVGAYAVDVGDFKDAVEIVLNTSRLYNAAVGTGMMQRAFREAYLYAQHRTAFGRPIAHFPAVARSLAHMKAEVYGARAVTFALAALSDKLTLGDDKAPQAPTARDAFRMLVNLNKFWVSETSTSVVREAIEVMGGNGAIEEFSVLPRLLRDSIVCEQWEGPHNVLCAQVMRDARDRKLDAAMWDYLRSLGNDAAHLDRVQHAQAEWNTLHQLSGEDAHLVGRDVLLRTRTTVQELLLLLPATAQDPACQAAAALLALLAQPGPVAPNPLRQLVARILS